MEESDVENFKFMLDRTLQQLKESRATEEFAKYFNTHYVPRAEQWATCFRKSANINTNMYVESFHRTLKYVYMKGRINKRIDNLIHVLIKISRDKLFEQLSKLEKGKISGRLSAIRKRHLASTNLSVQLVTQKSDMEWSVQSNDQKQDYTVTLENVKCTMSCQLVCRDCSVCIHIYICMYMHGLHHKSYNLQAHSFGVEATETI